ncbi:purine-nucleoside phosphorylase [[Mycoplasma] testudinis]|uniref:purine-nucleoside phosphorylase n=1 Tax=[Mycoplasma] testudinis TaxID=33924 RepID=UPI00069906DF|nr:purine-nucleoside phosphorylase [[Mycoplasma] testudinis]
MTPHINAKLNDVAKVVLMPGDPLRAKWIAENFLKDAKCINEVRGMLGFTGTYKGKKITVMGHGMGIPSIGIYSHELMRFYDVDTVIRVGSCAALKKEMKLGDVVIAKDAYSESSYARLINVKAPNNTLPASSEWVAHAEKMAANLNLKTVSGTVVSEDAFYQNIYKAADMVKAHNALSVEMEAFGLYANAIRNKKQALTILTVSDSLVTKDSMSPLERQTSFRNMISLALEMAIRPPKKVSSKAKKTVKAKGKK